eukprot:gnl/TRDRNA2_/TRDRNA2_149220_c1_seq1.p1 gnl/TRDRNA2_/TRDRNA2_149220_c1~~gnl/TRDRNA2_/TRDRNA2_149220_c1_seq1.p1  ORF type:complete len:288 (-),score=41.75 gnl/TRDRNA2_/TRDRNA2_149220_c1_seq1:196-1008(-)
MRGAVKGSVSWSYVFVVALLTSGCGTLLGGLLASTVSDVVQLYTFVCLVMAVAVHLIALAWKTKEDSSSTLNTPTTADLLWTARLGRFAGESDYLEDRSDSMNTDPSTEWSGVDAVKTTDMPGPVLTVQRPSLWNMPRCQRSILVTGSVSVGLVCGFTGIGAGFMLVPLLCLMGHSMETAVPTASVVICLTALSGGLWYNLFLGMKFAELDRWLVTAFVVAGGCGSCFAEMLTKYVPTTARHAAFAVILLVMALGLGFDAAMLPPGLVPP